MYRLARPLILALSLCVIFNAPAWAKQSGCTEASNRVSQFTEKLACDVDDLAAQIDQGDTVVPTRLYHYGQKKLLLQDVAAHTVPQDAWDQFIMGKQGSGRYRLKAFRQGLYGTGGLDTNFFNDGADYDWLIEIELDPSCVTPNHVGTFIRLSTDPKFLKWFAQAKDLPFQTVADFNSQCYPNNSTYPLGAKAIEGGESADNPCESTLNRYLDEAGIKVVQDFLIEKSFYVRDRSCIKNIRGSAEDLINILAEERYLWHTPCPLNYGKPDEMDNVELQFEHEKNLETFPRLLSAALIDSKDPISQKQIELLTQNIRSAPWEKVQLGTPNIQELLIETMKAQKRCREKDKADDFKTLVNSVAPLRFTYLDPAQFAELCK